MLKVKKKIMSDIDYNKSSLSCPQCAKECEKMNKRINKRKLSKINNKEFPHILKVFNF